MSSLYAAAVQFELALSNYSSVAAFRRSAQAGAEEAARAADAAGAEHRLIVYPECIGHFIPLALAPSIARRMPNTSAAMAILALQRPLDVYRGLRRAEGWNVSHAVLHAILPDCEAVMREVFGEIARSHGAVVVAGSHLRAASTGELYNSSFTFDSGGRLLASCDKVNLVPGFEDSEGKGLGLSPGDLEQVAAVDAPFGKLVTAICYDGFCVPHTDRESFRPLAPTLEAAGVDVVANPAASPWLWDGPWYFARRGDTRTRGEQWLEEGLPASMQSVRGVQLGITAHLVGEALEHRFEGRSEILRRASAGVEVIAQARGHREPEVVGALVALSATKRNSAA